MKKRLTKWLAFSLAGILVLSQATPVLQASGTAETEYVSEIPEEESCEDEFAGISENNEEETSSDAAPEEETSEEKAGAQEKSKEEPGTGEELSEEDKTGEESAETEESASEEDIAEEAGESEEGLAQEEESVDEPLSLITDVTLLDEALVQGANVGVPIDVNTFPDELFRKYVLEACDTNKDSVLQSSELTLKSINFTSAYDGIEDLKGIEYFRSLTSLYCDKLNTVNKLDVSYNYNLEWLNCCGNHISQLDVRNNKKLTNLYCESNYMTRLILGENENLSALKCANNFLDSLDVSKCNRLQILHLQRNQFTKLDVSKNTQLVYLDFSENRIASINLSQNRFLTSIKCNTNKLTKLDVGKCNDLTELYCADNQLAALNLKVNKGLRILDCSSNYLSQLDLQANYNLRTLNAKENSLNKLNLDKNTELTSLIVGNNMLEILELSKNTKLTELECSYNALTSLDIPKSCTSVSANYMTCAVELNEDNAIDLRVLPKMPEIDRVIPINGSVKSEMLLVPDADDLKNGYAEYIYKADNETDMHIALTFNPCEITVDMSLIYENYTGVACKPKPIIRYGNKIMAEGKDYTLSYKNNVKAATADSKNPPTITIKMKGNYKQTITKTFDILPFAISSYPSPLREMLKIEDVHVKYSGKKILGVPAVTLKGKKISVSEFEFEYPDTGEGAYTEPGVYSIIVKGKGINFSEQFTVKQYVESGMSVSKAKIELSRKSCPYNETTGMAIPESVTVKVGGKTLTEGTDYKVSYMNHKSVGTATVIVTGIGEYTGVKKATYKVTGVKLTSKMIEMKITSFAYDASVRHLGTNAYSIKHTYKENNITKTKELKEGIDFICKYPTTPIKVGKHKVVFAGIGGYTGSVTKTFEITKVSVNKLAETRYTGTDYIYRSDGVYPKTDIHLNPSMIKLVEGVDYVLEYKNHKKAASSLDKNAPQVFVKGIGGITGTYALSKFSIVQAPLSTHAKLNVTDVLYADKKNNYVPKFTITEAATGKKLAAKKDYGEIVYEYKTDGVWLPVTENRVPANASALKITVKAAEGGNFCGEISAEYHFYTKQISKVSVEKLQTRTYTGQQIRPLPVVTISEKKDGKTTTVKLVHGKDYVLEYGTNLNAGTGTVTIRGIGEYGGTKTVKFKIQAAGK